MPGKIERSIDELYQDDPERADAVAFGRRTGVDRRGFLGGTGLAAMGVAVGGSIPFAENMPGGLIPAALIPSAMAQAPAPGAAPKGPQYLEFSRQERQAGRARRASAGRGDARAPARRRHHADRQVLHPQQRPDAGSGQGSRRLEDRRRRRGQPEARTDARRAEGQVPAGDAAPGAGMRRQRPLVLLAAGARQPVDQRRRRLRRMDRRAARRRAQGRRASSRPPSSPATTAPTAASPTPARMRSRAASRSRRRSTPTTSSCSR